MKKKEKHFTIFSIFFVFSILSVWGIEYWNFLKEIPWAGIRTLDEPWFIEARNNYFIEHCLIMSIFLFISFGVTYWIWLRKKEIIDKIAFGLMIWVTISLFLIMFYSYLMVFPLAFSCFLSLIVTGWGVWIGRWKFPTMPLILSVLYAGYSIFNFFSWFAVYGD